MAIAEAITWILEAYAAAGILFAAAFVLFGVERVDRAARGGTAGFRLIIAPGVAALWPLLLRRWVAGACDPPVERNAHRERARRGGRL